VSSATRPSLRSKVVLSVHFYEAKIFEIVRVSYLLTNTKAVVAECGRIPWWIRACVRRIHGWPYEGLVDACEKLVRDVNERQALAQRGYRIFAGRREEKFLATTSG